MADAACLRGSVIVVTCLKCTVKCFSYHLGWGVHVKSEKTLHIVVCAKIHFHKDNPERDPILFARGDSLLFLTKESL